jgi:hypothetical protein
MESDAVSIECDDLNPKTHAAGDDLKGEGRGNALSRFAYISHGSESSSHGLSYSEPSELCRSFGALKSNHIIGLDVSVHFPGLPLLLIADDVQGHVIGTQCVCYPTQQADVDQQEYPQVQQRAADHQISLFPSADAASSMATRDPGMDAKIEQVLHVYTLLSEP